MAEQGETPTAVRNRLSGVCRRLPTAARVYTVGRDALLIVSDGGDPGDARVLAWLDFEDVKVCFVCTLAEDLSAFAPLFGGEFPAFQYYGIHESLEEAWSYLSRGGIGARQNGQHHLSRSLGVYAKACLRNLRARTPSRTAQPARARGAPRREVIRRVTVQTTETVEYLAPPAPRRPPRNRSAPRVYRRAAAKSRGRQGSQRRGDK